MRHRKATKKLSRNTSNRKALMKSLLTSLITHERISTTYEKAKAASQQADKLITLGKRNTTTSKKYAISTLGSKLLINKLFDDIAPRFAGRQGGYTRVLHFMPRKGDGAEMAILELTERKVIEPAIKKKDEKRARRASEAEVKEKAAEHKKAVIEKRKPTKVSPKHGEVKIPTPAEKTPILEEKPQVSASPKPALKPAKEKLDEEKNKEKARSEKEKLTKGFFRGLKRYFRGKSQ